MKIGLNLVLANDRETNTKRSYDSIRAIAQQAETDGFDSLWLPDNFFERDPGSSRPAGHVGMLDDALGTGRSDTSAWRSAR